MPRKPVYKVQANGNRNEKKILRGKRRNEKILFGYDKILF